MNPRSFGIEGIRYWKSRIAYWSNIVDGLRGQPSHELDIAYDAMTDAMDARRRLTLDAWAGRNRSALSILIHPHTEGREAA